MSDVTMTREEELWEKLVDEAGEDLIEQAAAVSVADAEAELRAAGFDVAEERARAEAFLTWLERGGAAGKAAEERVAQAVPQVAEGPSAPARREGSRREGRKVRPAVWVAAAAAVAAGAAVTYVATHPEETPVAKPTPSSAPTTPTTSTSTAAPAPAPDVVAAAELRRRAAVALAADRLDDCFALLDEARQKDPAGDAAPETQQLREKAERAREAKPKP